MGRGWLERARSAAARAPSRPRWLLCLATSSGPVEIGSIEPEVATGAVDAGLPLRLVEERVVIEAPFDASLDRIAHWLSAQGLGGRWRDERLPVVDRSGAMHATIERGSVRALGLATFAVHLSGRTADGRWWVQQRAFDKATDPGLWDTLMGGQLTAGEGIADTLERETVEEAGLSPSGFLGLHRVEDVSVYRPVPEGYVVERIAVFRATLAPAVVPHNRDGEVIRFECLDSRELRRRLSAGAFTLEATLILGAELEASAP